MLLQEILRIDPLQRRSLQATTLGAAVLLFVLGTGTMAAWESDGIWARELFTGIFAMKMNSALAFVISGVGLLGAHYRSKRTILIAGALVLTIGTLSTIEYVTGLDLGLDQLLVADTYYPDSLHPGRMAPNTALAFACVGLQLILATHCEARHSLRIAVMTFLGFLVLALGVEGVIGYLHGTGHSYSWGRHRAMSPQTAVGILALGIGLLAAHWQRVEREEVRAPLLVPILLCFGILTVDLVTPRGIAIGIAYVPLIFCSLWFTRSQTPFVFAAIASALAILALFVKVPGDAAFSIVVINRAIAIGAIWFVAALVHLRMRSDRKLLKSENHLRAIMDCAVDGLVSIDARGVIESVNPTCERIFGYSAEEIVGQNVKMLMPEPYHSEHDGYLSHYLTTGEAKIIGTAGREVSGRRKDGSVFPIDLSISAFRLEDGQHFSGLMRDITQRKSAEGDTSLLAAIVAASDDPIISKTLDGTITSWNAAAKRLFGYPQEEAVGQNIRMILPPERWDEETHILSQMREGKTVEHFESVEVAKDGHPIDVSVSVSPIRNSTGQVVGVSTIVRDISARKKAEAELAHYVEALERSNKELDDFAYIASHDLKEPLRGLFNNAKFLQEDYQDKLAGDGVARLTRLGYLSQHMEQLVNDLLYFSRLGRQELAVQRTDLNAVIRDIEMLSETTFREQNATIIIPTPLPELICDKPGITEVFRNLLANAVKYNDRQEKFVEVGFFEEMQTERGIERKVFWVRDNGIGIAEEFHAEIFRIFKRLNVEDDSKKGTGVGLTFVKKIVERHGGRIWLKSEPGLGTTFYFTIGQGVDHGTKASAAA